MRSQGLLPTTKAGAGDKEPAFIVLKTHFCKFVSILILLTVLVGLKFYDNESQFENVKLKLHGVAKTLHMSEIEHSKAHAEIAKVGVEFEQHLDRDLHELEAGQKLLKNLKLTHDVFHKNISLILQNEIKSIRNSLLESEEIEKLTPEKVLDQIENNLKNSLDMACSNLFQTELISVNGLLRRLEAGAREAADRKEDLQGEIRHNLHEGGQMNQGGSNGEMNDGEMNGDDAWWKNEEENYENMEEDDHWAKETEKWHNQTVDLFFDKLDSWMHPNVSDTKPHPVATYDSSSSLFEELSKAQDHLKDDVTSWRDIQDLIHSKAEEIKSLGLPPYTDADEPEDDGYQGFQSWHVQSYLDELLWPALLRSHLPQLLTMKNEIQKGISTPMNVIDVLEGLASDNVIPHHWLHHGGHEYYYGGRDDYF